MCEENPEGFDKENAPKNTSFVLVDNDEQLANKITKLAGKINAAEYRFLKLVAEFDRREAWGGAGIKSCAHWLNWKCGIATGAAREKVRVARALEGLPGINAAFEKGEISYSKVRAMTRVANEENESFLLMIAEYGTAHHMEKLVQKYQYINRPGFSDGEHEEQNIDQQENRELAYYRDIDGMWIIHAKLPGEEGGLFVKALEAIVDRLPTSRSLSAKSETDIDSDSEAVGMSQNGAENVPAETFSNGSDSDIHFIDNSKSHCEDEEEPISIEQRRADALGMLAEHFLAGEKSNANGENTQDKRPLASLKGVERCQLILHVRPEGCYTGPGTYSHVNCDLDGQWLPPDAAKKLACDASLLVVEEDEVGNVLDIGRRTRVIPPAISRALAIRDGGCQFPGCCNTRYVEGHHVVHWSDGGETKLENLVTLCGYHHLGLHRGDYSLTILPKRSPAEGPVGATATHQVQRFSDRLVFTRGDNGEVIPRDACRFTPDCCDENAFEQELPLDIDEQTAVTKWTGERMDMGMAIDAMISPNKPIRGQSGG